MYTPESIKAADGSRKAHPIIAFKATCRMAASAAYNGAPISGPVRVDVVAVFPRPAAKVWATKPMPRYRHTVKPDRDNLDKAILDCLTGIVLVDDRQACAGTIDKWHAAGDEQPHVLITITRIAA